jgi:hypothetical protein
MLSVAAKTGWSEGFERLEGKLLGYKDWQTDIHLERLRASHQSRSVRVFAGDGAVLVITIRQLPAIAVLIRSGVVPLIRAA